MLKYALAVAVALVLAAPLLSSSAAQKRVKQDEPEDFPTILAASKTAWDAEKYGACIEKLNQALALASEKRVEKIREALPAAPAGWEVLPEKKNNAAAVPGLAAFAATVGNVIERRTAMWGASSVNTALAHVSLCQLLGMRERWDEAAAECRRAIAIHELASGRDDPTIADLWQRLAKAERAAGREEAAEIAEARARELAAP